MQELSLASHCRVVDVASPWNRSRPSSSHRRRRLMARFTIVDRCSLRDDRGLQGIHLRTLSGREAVALERSSRRPLHRRLTLRSRLTSPCVTVRDVRSEPYAREQGVQRGRLAGESSVHEAIVGRGHRAPEKPLSVGARIISVSPTIASHCTPPLRLNLRGVPAASQQMSAHVD